VTSGRRVLQHMYLTAPYLADPYLITPHQSLVLISIALPRAQLISELLLSLPLWWSFFAQASRLQLRRGVHLDQNYGSYSTYPGAPWMVKMPLLYQFIPTFSEPVSCQAVRSICTSMMKE
jgi:hypothetical protein